MKVLKTNRKSPFIKDDKLHEECGVFGVYNHEDSAALTALGLHALQHRGQEAAGIVTFDGTKFISERHPGLVSDNFTKTSVINRLVDSVFVVVSCESVFLAISNCLSESWSNSLTIAASLAILPAKILASLYSIAKRK